MLAPALLLALPLGASDESALAEFQWLDWNSDGLQDSYVFVPGGQHQLLANRGDGVFDDVTAAVGLDCLEGSVDAAWADYDSDGWMDLASLDGTGTLHLYRTADGVTFAEATAVLGLDVEQPARSLEWRDMDGDELPELVLFGDRGIRVVGNPGYGVLVAPPSHVRAGDMATDHGALLGVRSPDKPAAGRDRDVGSDDLVVVDDPHQPQIGGKSKASLSPTCALGIVDTAGGPCLEASSNPTLGALYPLGDFPVLDPMGQGAAVLHAPDTNTVELELFGNRDLRLREGASYVTLGVGTGAGEGTLGALEVAGPLIASSLDTLELQLTGTGGDVSLTSVEESPGEASLEIRAEGIALENVATQRVLIEPVETLDDMGMNPFFTIEINGRPLQGEGSKIAFTKQATVGGGSGNQALGQADIVAGGTNNTADSTLFGGPTGAHATVGGGFLNAACNSYSAVGGGFGNRCDAESSIIAGGQVNSIDAGYIYSTIGGGNDNTIQASHSTIAGGNGNTVGAVRATIAGGLENEIVGNGEDGSIGGGWKNSVSGLRSTIGGGSNNTAIGFNATVGGGDTNAANSFWSTVGGGQNNSTGLTWATVGGGLSNSASGTYSTVPGGTSNSAAGAHSMATGWDAHALHDNCFVWSDGTSAPFASTGVDQFLVEASGGVGINTNNPGYDLDVNGDFCATVICTPSDARLKRDVRELSAALETVLALRGVTFEWDPDVVPDADPGRQLGFLAQEVREVVPEVVHEDRDGGLSVSYASLVPLLVEAIREQEAENRARFEALEEQLADLMGEKASPDTTFDPR